MPNFLQGLAIGFSIAAPVGPIGVLCIRRSIAHGRLAGFVSGLGAASADAIYGAVAALGLTALMNALLAFQRPLQLAGGIFLVGLGVATMRRGPAGAEAQPPAGTNLATAYFSILALTLTNPMTILSFLGIFAGLGLGSGPGGAPEAMAAGRLVLGVFLGSTAWWLLLSAVAHGLGARLQPGGLRALNLTSGLVIAGFGAWQLALWLGRIAQI